MLERSCSTNTDLRAYRNPTGGVALGRVLAVLANSAGLRTPSHPWVGLRGLRDMRYYDVIVKE